MKVAVMRVESGGMSLALSLHAAGIGDVEIYESAPVIRELDDELSGITEAELEEIADEYKRVAGFDVDRVNNGPSLSVG